MTMSTLVDIEARFTAQGAYRVRRGPAHAGTARCPVNKKLCLYATDRESLIRELDALASRPECFWVKYGATPRDGMWLGRAFFVDEAMLGLLWASYRAHTRLYCSVQDDDWASSFR